MKQTLTTWEIYHVTGVGSTPKLRLAADQDFVAESSELVLQGNAEENYVEITPTLVGTTLTVPNITNIDTNDDSSQPNGTYTLYLVNSQGKKPRVIFERWHFKAGMGSVIIYEDLEISNNHKIPLRDAETYSKRQVDVLLQNIVNVGNPATVAALGRVKMSVDPADAASPIAVGPNDYATTSRAALTRLSTAPQTSTIPIAVGDNDPRVVEVSNWASLAAAIAAIGATPTTLQVTSAITGVATATVPATTTLKFIRGGSLSITTGQTLTILGPIIADNVQIFLNALAGQGTVSIVENRYTREIGGNWWGAGTVADGIADSTDELQAAITCAGTAQGVIVDLVNTGSSYYACSGQLSFTDLAQVTLRGCGSGRQGGSADGNIPNSGKTEIRYSGTGTDSFIVGGPCRVITLEGLVIRYTSGSFTGDLVSFYSPGQAGSVSAHNWIRECLLGGFSTTADNARSCAFFRNNVGGGLDNCTLMLAVHGVIGRGCLADLSLGTGFTFSNSVTLRKVKFDYISDYAVVNPGAHWTLFEDIFEFGPDGKGRAITTEDTDVNTGYGHTLDCKALSVIGCGFFDSTDGGTWVKLRAKGAVFTGNFVTLYNDGASLDGKFIELWASSGDRAHSIVVTGNSFDGTVSSYDGTYIDQTNAPVGVMTGVIFEGNAGNTVPIPPPSGISYAARSLASLHFTTASKTASGNVNLEVEEGHAFVDASAGNQSLRLDEDATFDYFQGRVQALTRIDAATNTAEVIGRNGATINGSTSPFPLSRWQTAKFINLDGTNWATFDFPGLRTGVHATLMLPTNQPFNGTTTTDAISDSNNAIKAMRFVVSHPLSISKIAARIGTAGLLMGLGIYSAAGAKLASADSIDVSGGTATVVGTLSSAVVLYPNVSYWIAWGASTTVPTFFVTAALSTGAMDLWNQTQNFVTAANAMAAGAMPATLGALTSITASDSLPILHLHN